MQKFKPALLRILCVVSFTGLFYFANVHAEAAEISYSIVTSEIKSAPPGEKEIEIYRFDPGVLLAHQGDQVHLTFYGVKGKSHPIEIQGYGIHTIVNRGETKTVTLTAIHPGTFKIICTAHPTIDKHGPMEAVLIVLPR